MPVAIEAALWGLLAGSALLLGAGIAWIAPLPRRLVAAVMALGAGVLISAVSFELMGEAAASGGLRWAAGGFLAGAGAYTAANLALARGGARHRKRSGGQPDERQPHRSEGGGLAIAVGALLDGVPEAVVIGASLLGGAGVSLATVAAVFLSNVPEGLSSAAGMREAGRPAAYVFGVWGGIALASGVAAFVGAWALAGADPVIIAAIQALAAGAILAMIADTMIPEAFEATREYAGLVTAAGFLLAFVLSSLG
jgi:ZIP family zinc transporter